MAFDSAGDVVVAVVRGHRNLIHCDGNLWSRFWTVAFWLLSFDCACDVVRRHLLRSPWLYSTHRKERARLVVSVARVFAVPQMYREDSPVHTILHHETLVVVVVVVVVVVAVVATTSWWKWDDRHATAIRDERHHHHRFVPGCHCDYEFGCDCWQPIVTTRRVELLVRLSRRNATRVRR